jgi:peroxiredoxin
MDTLKKSRLVRNRLIAPLAVLAAPILVIVGLYASIVYSNAHLPPPPPPQQSLVFREGEDHPVTSNMVKAARELGGRKAPGFSGQDIHGKPVSLASLSRDKPVVLFFVELQCPCCKGAKPYIDRIKNYYGDVCNVVGIIDAKPDMAKLWSQTVGPQFDVIPDPTMSIVRSYKADRGTYTTLIAPGGRIVKAYPGYCQDMLKDITGKIVRLTGIRPRPMPLEPAPKRMTSGCIFPGTKLPGDEL